MRRGSVVMRRMTSVHVLAAAVTRDSGRQFASSTTDMSLPSAGTTLGKLAAA